MFQKNCWNCGRKANETCSGCNSARYCGSFCQHKDWDTHQKDCGKLKSLREQQNKPPRTASPVMVGVGVEQQTVSSTDEKESLAPSTQSNSPGASVQVTNSLNNTSIEI